MKLQTRTLVRLLLVASVPLTAPDAIAQSGPPPAPAVAGKPGDAFGGPPPPPPGPEYRGGPFGGPGPMSDKFGGPPPPLSHALSVAETELGIRSTQIDVWRDFTDALLAVTAPPSPPPAPAAGQVGPPKPEPFAIVRGLANDFVERGKKAETLIKATEALRSRLTPEQLDKLAAIEFRLLPPPPGGPRPPFGHGPGGSGGPGPKPLPDQSGPPTQPLPR